MPLIEKVIAGVQSHGFALQISVYPKEVKHIVTMYRFCFGCSFSGVIFTDDVPVKPLNGGVKGTKVNNSHHTFNFLISLFYIFANATLMVLFLVPFTVIPLYFSPSKADEPMKLSDFINIARYNIEFEDIKPLLRLIMQSIFYVFIVEMIINNGCNLLYGGRLVAELVELANSLLAKEKQSTKHSTANGRWTISRIVAIKLAVVSTLITVSLLLFNRSRLVLLIHGLLEPEKLTMLQKNELLKMVFLTAWHFCDYLTHLMWPILFLYTMNLFSSHVRRIREFVESVEVLDESRLEAITDQLSILSIHFRRIISYFSLPLSVILTINVVSIIGSCCFLSQNSQLHQEPQHKYYISALFTFGVYALLRMVLIAWTSSLPDGEVRELIRVVHRNSPTTAESAWSANGWLCFSELRKLRARFTVTFLDDCLSIKQSTVLSLLGFTLQYTVVLLQTNDYGTVDGGSSRNATLA